MPANTAYILKTMDQGVILTFKCYYLRNAFCKVVTVADSEYSGRSGTTLRIFCTGLTILVAIKNIYDLWKDVKISTIKVWKKLIPTLRETFRSLRLNGESECRCGVNSKKIELEVEPEGVTGSLQSHNKTCNR